MGEKRGMKALEAWCRNISNGYRDVRLDNMTTSWRDGLAFCAIIHHFRPDLIFRFAVKGEHLSQQQPSDKQFQSMVIVVHHLNQGFDSVSFQAFTVAEQRLGIPALLDAEDMVTFKVPDKLSIMTYLSQLYKYFSGMEQSSLMKTPTKRSLDENDSMMALANPPGKLVSPSPSSVFVGSSPRIQRTDKCQSCKNRVYILERLIVDNKLYHRTCFKCHKCAAVLRPGSYVESDDDLEIYECIQCPLDEEKCDVSRSATTAALRRFSGGRGNNPPSSVDPPAAVSSVSQPATPSSNVLLISSSSVIAKARSEFCAQADGTESEFVDSSTPVTDTGQKEASPQSIIKINRKLFDSPDVHVTKLDVEKVASVGPLLSPHGADLRNNNVPTKDKDVIIIEKLDELSKNDVVHAMDVKNATNDAKSNSVDVDDDSNVIIRENLSSFEICHSDGLPVARYADCEDSEPMSDHRKSVSEMVKMFALNSPKVSTVGPLLSEEPVIVLVPAESVCQERVPDVEKREMEKGNDEMTCEDAKDVAVQEACIIPKPTPRSKRPKAVVDLCKGQVPFEVSPVALLRRKTTDITKAEDDTQEEPPPKPPRSSVPDELAHKTKADEYPSHLNPFGDESEEEETGEASKIPTPLKIERKSLNPFGSSEDEDENQETVSRTLPQEDTLRKSHNVVPSGRTSNDLLPRNSLNPFASDCDSEDEIVEQPRLSVAKFTATSPQHCIDKSETTTLTLGRKKRLAPKPPNSNSPNNSGSAASSPLVTPIPSPQMRRKTFAAPPPPTPNRLEQNISSSKPRRPPTLDVSSISLSPSVAGSDNGLTEKSLKELDNMNLSKVSSSSLSDQILSPDLSNSQSTGQFTNTFGYWKRKKKPAPPVPFPQRRQIKKIPLKEIQAELVVIEMKQLQLEKHGVKIEMTIREKFCDDIEPSTEEEDLIMQLFELVNKKNSLFRRQAELIYLRRQQRLEEEHADLEFQIRCLMEKPDNNKSEEDSQLEEKLIARLIDVVHQRNEIIESMEMDRLREAEEDQSIQEQMALQKYQPHRGSVSSQSSYGSSQSGASSSKGNKLESKKKKDKKTTKKVNDEDKDLDEAEFAAKTKEKKRKWF